MLTVQPLNRTSEVAITCNQVCNKLQKIIMKKTILTLAILPIALTGGAVAQTVEYMYFGNGQSPITSGTDTIGYRYDNVLNNGDGSYVNVTITTFSTPALGGYSGVQGTKSPVVYPSTAAYDSNGYYFTFNNRPDGSLTIPTGDYLDIYSELNFKFYDASNNPLDISNYRFVIGDVDYDSFTNYTLQDFVILDSNASDVVYDPTYIFQSGSTYMAVAGSSGGMWDYDVDFRLPSGTTEFNYAVGARKTNTSANAINSTFNRGVLMYAYTTVPEPSSALLLALGGLGLLVRKKYRR